MATPDEENIGRVPLALLIPALTALLYVYSFAFEVGYAKWFGYPAGLVTVTLDLILNVGTAFFLWILWIFTFLQLNMQYWPSTRIHTSAFLALLVVYFACVIGARIWLPEYFYFSFLLSSVFAYLGGRALAKFEAAPPEERKDRIPNVYDPRSVISKSSIGYALIQRLGFDPLLFALAIVLVLPALFAGVGYAEARSKSEFLAFEESGEDYVALRIGGGSVIAAKSNHDENTKTKQFIVRDVRDVGRLTVTDAPP